MNISKPTINPESSSSYHPIVFAPPIQTYEIPATFSNIVGKFRVLHSAAATYNNYPPDFLYETWEEIGRLQIWAPHLDNIPGGEVPLHTLDTLKGLLEEMETYLTYGVDSVCKAPTERLAIAQKAEADDRKETEVDVKDINVDELDLAEVLHDISDVITSLYRLGPALSHSLNKPSLPVEPIAVTASSKGKGEPEVDEMIKAEDDKMTCGYCCQFSYGEMIACDNDDCPEWFHLSCTGLTGLPARNDKWYCNECKEELNNDPFPVSFPSSPNDESFHDRFEPSLYDDDDGWTEDATAVPTMPTSSSLPVSKTRSGAVKLAEGLDVGLSYKTDNIRCFRLYKGKLLQVSL